MSGWRPPKRRNKYNARKVYAFGFVFDSKIEYQRYVVLLEREQNGKITDLRVHPRFEVFEGFTDNKGIKRKPIHYEADFEYTDGAGNWVVEDVKGKDTDMFRLKMKLFLFAYRDADFRVIRKKDITR